MQWLHVFLGVIILFCVIGLISKCEQEDERVTPIHMGAER